MCIPFLNQSTFSLVSHVHTPMKHYDYQKTLKELLNHSVDTYRKGNRKPDSYFDESQLKWMAENGIKVMDLYDFAEDFVSGGEPDFETFLLIHDVRRNYLLHVQKRETSSELLDPDSLPAKTDAVEGIEWLPRILPKAKAKLKGELPPDIMFCCGGDRRFFKTHDIHPAEFLRVVWANMEDDAATIAWVKTRSSE